LSAIACDLVNRRAGCWAHLSPRIPQESDGQIAGTLDSDLDLAESAVEGVGIDRHDRYEGIVRLQDFFKEIFQGLPTAAGLVLEAEGGRQDDAFSGKLLKRLFLAPKVVV